MVGDCRDSVALERTPPPVGEARRERFNDGRGECVADLRPGGKFKRLEASLEEGLLWGGVAPCLAVLCSWRAPGLLVPTPSLSAIEPLRYPSSEALRLSVLIWCSLSAALVYGEGVRSRD